MRDGGRGMRVSDEDVKRTYREKVSERESERRLERAQCCNH